MEHPLLLLFHSQFITLFPSHSLSPFAVSHQNRSLQLVTVRIIRIIDHRQDECNQR